MIVAYITVAICLDLIDSLRNIITEKERETHTHTHTYIYIQTYIIHNIIICFFCFISFTRSFIRRHVRLWPQLLNQSTLVPTSSNVPLVESSKFCQCSWFTQNRSLMVISADLKVDVFTLRMTKQGLFNT